jgi:hypothetical protein
MGNILSKNIPANTRYTEFENNQVLTADQLNDLFRYLDIQTRLTRTKAIGVGIICGLEIGVTDEGTIVLSKGTAITTDGDLLHVSGDMSFDQYLAFEDTNARYDYFHLDGGEQIPLFLLASSKTNRENGKLIGGFERETNTALKDYVGILYLEDYSDDADLCTGVDCDNKGIECVKDLKVLLAHKDRIAELLKSIPKMNRQYFALEDMDVPRVMLKNSISKYDELRGAFATALGVKDALLSKLQKAYEVCKPIVEDDLDSDDAFAAWKDLLEQHFKLQAGIYVQYLYDLCRDLSYAYNEMRESLFNDDHLCCPPIELFPKHVLLGLLKNATIKRPVLTAVIPDRITTTQPVLRFPQLNLATTIRFDIASLIRRFHPIHIDIEYRHSFYASPVLNNNETDELKTRFYFKRIDTMIRNFSVPTAETLRTVENIKIIPGLFEERPIGERAIPFYYKYDRSNAINAYWNYDANARQKEDNIYYYFSNLYSETRIPKDPLQFNLLPYSFFRIEGHIGYKYQEVERMLNKLINDYNLPINLMTVQVERDIRTIPNRDWWFPHLHIYEQFVRNTFNDHINQVDLVNVNLKKEIENDPDIGKISLSMNNFSNVKTRMQNHQPATSPQFNVANFKRDVSDMITATTEIKANTQKFTFSNTAAPHDFIINTDILHKTDSIADLINAHIIKKKENLFLGNFMKSNSGLEHAGGVLRGGTFVLVYTANDDKVVADFMLPYASVDKDIVPEPPVVRPMPLPEFPKYQIPKVFEKIPPYRRLIDEKALDVTDKIRLFDDRVKEADSRIVRKLSDMDDSKKVLDEKVNGFDNKVKDVEGRLNQRIGDIDTTKKLFDANVKLFEDKIKTVDTVYTGKLTEFEKKLDYQGKIFTNIASVIPTRTTSDPGKLTGLLVGGKDIGADAELMRKLAKEVEVLQPNTPERISKEGQLAEVTKRITDVASQPTATVNKEDEANIKSILFDAQQAADKIVSTQNAAVRNTVAGNVNKASVNIGTRLKG